MTSAPNWNGVRFRPESSEGHVESYFLKLNDPEGRRALWLKATILRRLGRPAVAEAWAIAFDRDAGPAARKQVVDFESASFSRERMELCVGPTRFEPAATRGLLAGDAGDPEPPIEWDLRFSGDAPAWAPLPARLYADRLGTGKIATPHPDLRFDGSYRVGDRRVEVSGWHGMQGHNWGRRHPHAYGWGHCNVWRDAEDLVFEGITARIGLGPFRSPHISLASVTHEGVRFDFVPPRSLWRARGRETLRAWVLHARSGGATLHAHFRAETDDFVGLHYENPDGAMTYCLNSKLARGELRLEQPGRPPLVAHTEAAALEIGTRDPAHGVRMRA